MTEFYALVRMHIEVNRLRPCVLANELGMDHASLWRALHRGQSLNGRNFLALLKWCIQERLVLDLDDVLDLEVPAGHRKRGAL